MTLSEEDYIKLARMQAFSNQAVQDIQKLEEFTAYLQEMDARRVELEDLYTEDWYHISEEETLSPEQNLLLEAQIAPDNYSVLSQDTIWDQLQALSDARINLLKTLVALL